MTKTEQLIQTLEDTFPEGSPRRVVGRILINTEKPFAIRDIVNATGLSQGSVTSALSALRELILVTTTVVDGLQHHIIVTSDKADAVDVPDLMNKSFMSTTPDGFNVNGYFKGIGYGSMQLQGDSVC